jgi:hypothetical protein
MGWVVSVTPRPRFTPGVRTPGTHWTEGWVGPRDGLDTEVRGKISCLCRGSKLHRPVRSQTLYWLSYLGSCVFFKTYTKLIHRSAEQGHSKQSACWVLIMKVNIVYSGPQKVSINFYNKSRKFGMIVTADILSAYLSYPFMSHFNKMIYSFIHWVEFSTQKTATV